MPQTQRQQSTTTYPLPIFMASGANPVTGLTPAVTISKNGGAFGAAAGAVTEIANGWYSLAGNATDRNTLGTLYIHATATGADNYDAYCEILSFDPFTVNGAAGGGGTVAINHNTPTTNNFTITLGGVGIPGATIDCYLTSTLNAGVAGPSTDLGQAVTAADGTWQAPIRVVAPAAGTLNYTLVFSKPGTFAQYKSTFTVDSTGAVTVP